MSDSQNTDRKTQKYYQKRWVKVCGALLVLLPVLYFTALFGAKSYLTKWFIQNGADTAVIEKLWFNPFTGRLSVQGVDVQSGGESLFRHSSLVIDLGIGAIINKNIEVEAGGYYDLVLDLKQSQDGSWRIGSYTLPVKDGEVTDTASGEEVSSAWALLADFVHLENCKVTLKTPELDLELLIKTADLRKLTTREGESGATFVLNGELNGRPLLIDLTTLQVTPFLELQGDVKVDGFDFGELSALLQENLQTFAGELELAGALDLKMAEGGKIAVQYDGDINVAAPDIAGNGFAVKASSLGWKGAVSYESSENGLMLVETDGKLAANEYNLSLPDAEFETSEAVIELQGKNKVVLGETIAVQYDGSLLINDSFIALPNNEIEEERLLWQGEVHYDMNHEGEGQYVKTDGTLELGPFLLKTGEADKQIQVRHEAVDWKGAVVYGQKEKGIESYLDLSGKLAGEEISSEFTETGMLLEQDKVSLTADTQLVLGEQLDIKGVSSLVLEGFGLQGAGLPEVGLERFAIEDLEADGRQQLRLKELVSQGLMVTVPGNMPLDITVPEIMLSGFSTDDLANFSLEQLALNKPVITSNHNEKELLQLQGVTVEKLSLDEDVKVAADTVTMDSLILLRGAEDELEKPFLTLSAAKMTEISWGTKAGLSGEKLYFEDLVTTLIRDEEGMLNISRRLDAMKVTSETAEKNDIAVESAEKPAESAAGLIRLGEVSIEGQSHVHFEDHTLAVPYITDLRFEEVVLEDLDSSRPENKSPLVVKAMLEDRAPFSLTGDVSPFLKPVALDLKIKLANYPLSKLSAYTVQSVGTALSSGQLHVNSNLLLANDQIDMKNTIDLKRMETETISDELAAELNNQLPIPLDAALSLLRDSDRNISLEIPLDGPVNDLSVGVSDVLITALSKAIVPAASGYLMYALGPYGALAYVGMKVGENILRVELPPVPFNPGEIEIAEEHEDYLAKVAGIMEDRSETEIQVCPTVVSWDFMDESAIAAVEGDMVEIKEESRDKLIELGQKRAKAVQQYLVQQFGIDKARLLICDTLIETSKKKVPEVMLNL